LFDDFFKSAIEKASPGWRRVVAQSTLWGIPIPAHSTALSFFDGYRTETLPAVSWVFGLRGDYLRPTC
jgi:6-phosphogluconate dehydrogenase